MDLLSPKIHQIQSKSMTRGIQFLITFSERFLTNLASPRSMRIKVFLKWKAKSLIMKMYEDWHATWCVVIWCNVRFQMSTLPARSIALPAIFPSWIILYITPAAFLAWACPTKPWLTSLGSNASSSPSPELTEKLASEEEKKRRLQNVGRFSTGTKKYV